MPSIHGLAGYTVISHAKKGERILDATAFTFHSMSSTVDTWNEWTEGSYLEPDTVSGMGYLEAIKRVFPREV